MDMYRQLVVAVVIFTQLIVASNGEIHRAKSISAKNGGKLNKRSRTETYVAETLDEFDKEITEEELASGSEEMPEDVESEQYQVWFHSIICSMLVGLSGIFPLLVIPIEAGPALKHGAAANRLKLLLSFAVGGLLGDVFLHLLPEAWAHLDKDGHDHAEHMAVGMWVMTGILSFLIIEKVFAKEGEFDHMGDECDSSEDEEVDRQKEAITLQNKETDDNTVRNRKTSGSSAKPAVNGAVKNGYNLRSAHDKNSPRKTVLDSEIEAEHINSTVDSTLVEKKTDTSAPKEETIKVSGYLNLMANVIDNFTHGLAVAGSFQISQKVGYITTLAILLHEIPHEVGDFAILLRSGFSRWKAAKAQIFTASGGIIGAITALCAESAQAAGNRTAWVLPFTSGGFIYIALVTVVPDLLQESHGKESVKQILCLCGGIAAMALVTLVH